ncbi:hypothetical protein [Pseudomonas sp. PB106]|uniref:hypothetical protein n=1 Tax=Pseudomonas sp. PB106 TaxID=2494699 RepID=UPI00131AD81B|nr:hypothetical protein [Pseudomonas sp. PB106]KAE9644694.1 hypothetical protein EJA71_13115 [Pseudomonas sp. PB106]
MLKCHFCDKTGEYMPAPEMGAPYSASANIGLKLVTCDFHLHHCAFFVCADCWNAEKHLCKNEHRQWESRLEDSVASRGSKDTSIRLRWRYRYVDQNQTRFPSVCKRVQSEDLYCSRCGTQGITASTGDACPLHGCTGTMVKSHCPACIKLTLPDGNGISSACPAKLATKGSSTVERVSSTSQDVYESLPVRYRDRTLYERLHTLEKDPAAALLEIDSAWDTYVDEDSQEGEAGDVEAPVAEVVWGKYVATNIFFSQEWGMTHSVILLPEPLFEEVKHLTTLPQQIWTRAQRSSDEARAKAEEAANLEKTWLKGAIKFQPHTCHLSSMPPIDLSYLEIPNGVMKHQSILINPPKKSSGGHGGAVGRGNSMGDTGLVHAVPRESEGQLIWDDCDAFLEGRQASKPIAHGGCQGSLISAQIADDSRYWCLRSFHGSPYDLYMTLPDNEGDPEQGKEKKQRTVQHEVDNLTQEEVSIGPPHKSLDMPFDNSFSSQPSSSMMVDSEESSLKKRTRADRESAPSSRQQTFNASPEVMSTRRLVKAVRRVGSTESVPVKSFDNPSAYPDAPNYRSAFWDWNGRPLEVQGSVGDTWIRLTRDKLARREYKDTHLFIMKPHTTSRQTGQRDQGTFFDGISAAEVVTGVTNNVAAQTNRLGSFAPGFGPDTPMINYEWSHLIGDGEGGGIHRANLVASSRANNTEMMVIETLLQGNCKKLNDAGLDIVIRVEVTLPERIPFLETSHLFQGNVRFWLYLSHVGEWMRYRVWLRRRPVAVTTSSSSSSSSPRVEEDCLVIDHILDCHRRFISKDYVKFFAFQLRERLDQVLLNQYSLVLERSNKGKKKA